MSRRLGSESRWPDYLPFEPLSFPDAVGLTSKILEAVARREPDIDLNEQLERANRVTVALAFLAGATESGFVEQIDAYVHTGEYGVRVMLEKDSREI